jgi:hypothetical protein
MRAANCENELGKADPGRTDPPGTSRPIVAIDLPQKEHDTRQEQIDHRADADQRLNIHG